MKQGILGALGGLRCSCVGVKAKPAVAGRSVEQIWNASKHHPLLQRRLKEQKASARSSETKAAAARDWDGVLASMRTSNDSFHCLLEAPPHHHGQKAEVLILRRVAEGAVLCCASDHSVYIFACRCRRPRALQFLGLQQSGVHEELMTREMDTLLYPRRACAKVPDDEPNRRRRGLGQR